MVPQPGWLVFRVPRASYLRCSIGPWDDNISFGARLLSVLQETSHVAAIHSEAPTPLENLTGCIKVRLRNIEGSTEVLALPDKGSIRNVVSLALAQSLDSATTTFIDHQEDIILGNAASLQDLWCP